MSGQEGGEDRPGVRAVVVTAGHELELGGRCGSVETSRVVDGDRVVAVAVEEEDGARKLANHRNVVERVSNEEAWNAVPSGGHLPDARERGLQDQCRQGPLASERAD